MQDFKKLRVWEKAHLLAICIYTESRTFPADEKFGATSQLRRAATSIAANIAEGCGKQNKNDKAKYFNISLGSANETEYFLILSKDLGYLNPETSEQLIDQINQIKAMLIRLIDKVKTAPDK